MIGEDPSDYKQLKNDYGQQETMRMIIMRGKLIIKSMRTRNIIFQISGTDVQEDSMMIMLQPNVTNWIMLHQRDFNFQVFFETLHLSKRADPCCLFSNPSGQLTQTARCSTR